MTKDDEEIVVEVDHSDGSLTREAKRTRNEALKSEISDFAKLSPETVAAIIREMFRKEEH